VNGFSYDLVPAPDAVAPPAMPPPEMGAPGGHGLAHFSQPAGQVTDNCQSPLAAGGACVGAETTIVGVAACVHWFAAGAEAPHWPPAAATCVVPGCHNPSSASARVARVREENSEFLAKNIL